METSAKKFNVFSQRENCFELLNLTFLLFLLQGHFGPNPDNRRHMHLDKQTNQNTEEGNFNHCVFFNLSLLWSRTMQRNWVIATNSNFLIPISLQSFQIWINLSNRIYNLKYLGSIPSGCKDIVVENQKFVAKTQLP